MIHMAYLGFKVLIYLASKASIALLLAQKVNVSKEYTNFWDIFFKKSAVVLLNYTNINKYAINLKPDKQPSYKSIYSLGPVKLEIFKTYIKANYSNKFIWPLKSLAKANIFFIQKPNGSLYLYLDYCDLNNLTIKN